MDAKSLRGWLLCKPRPIKLRIVREGEPAQTLEIQDGMSYAAVAKSVVAITPDLVEALDKDGQVIRALRPEDDEEEEEEEEEGFEVPTDGESQRFVIVAKLIGDAYKHSTQVAFDKLGDLFETATRRTESLERTVDALNKIMMRKAVEDAGEVPASGGGDFGQQLLASFLQGQAMRAAETRAATNGAPTNGAPPKEGGE